MEIKWPNVAVFALLIFSFFYRRQYARRHRCLPRHDATPGGGLVDCESDPRPHGIWPADGRPSRSPEDSDPQSERQTLATRFHHYFLFERLDSHHATNG